MPPSRPPKYRKARCRLELSFRTRSRRLTASWLCRSEISAIRHRNRQDGIPSLQARATLAAHRIFLQEAQASPAWRVGEKILQKVRSGEWRLGYFPPGNSAGTLQTFGDAIARLTPADFRFGRSRIMLDEVLIPVRCILAAREAEPGRRESRTTDRIEQAMRKDIAGRKLSLVDLARKPPDPLRYIEAYLATRYSASRKICRIARERILKQPESVTQKPT